MARFEDLSPTRRLVRGPISNLVELGGDRGPYTAVAYHEDYRDDDAVGSGLVPIRDFLELPMVDGVAPLSVNLPGLLVYRTGEIRTARELVGIFAEEGGCGARAALELLAKAGRALIDAAEAGRDRGLRSHGSIDPWRIGVTAGGEVVILGYGIPSLDVTDFLDDPELLPTSDTLRYCPPERLEGDQEDITSDLYALGLVVAEFATGRPLYPGRGEDLLAATRAGPTADQLAQLPPALARAIEPLFSGITSRRQGAVRTLSPQALDAAGDAEGRTLAELVAEAAPFLSDVEDELPSTFALQDLLPPDPDREAAKVEAQTAVSGVAATVVALSSVVEATLERVDDTYPEVAEALEAADRAVQSSEAAARQAEAAATRAARAPSVEAALAAAAEAVTASAAVQEASDDARRHLEQAVVRTATAKDEAIARLGVEARDHLAAAESSLIDVVAVEGLRDRGEALLGEIRRSADAILSPGEGADVVGIRAAFEILGGHLDSLKVLVDHAAAVQRARQANRSAAAMFERFPDHATELAQHLEEARTAAAEAEAAGDLADATDASARATEAAASAEAVGSILTALATEAEESRERTRAATAAAEAAYARIPHPTVRAHLDLAREALQRAESDGAAAADAAADAEAAARDAAQVADDLLRRVDEARGRARSALDAAQSAAEAVDVEDVQEILDVLRGAVATAEDASLPDDAADAADRAESARGDVLRRTEEVRGRLDEVKHEGQVALGRAEDTLGSHNPRLEPIREALAALARIRRLQEASTALDALRSEVEALITGQAALAGSREEAREALARAEATARGGPADHPAILAAIAATRDAVALAEGSDDPAEAEQHARTAVEQANEVTHAVETAKAAAFEALAEVRMAVVVEAERAATALQISDDTTVAEHVTAARAAAEFAASADLDEARQAVEQARAAADAAHVAAEAFTEALSELRGQALETVIAAQTLLDEVDLDAIRSAVQAVEEAARRAQTAEGAAVRDAVVAAQAALEAARGVARSARGVEVDRAQAAAAHARAVLEGDEDPEARLFAEASRAAAEEAATADTYPAAAQAAVRAIEAARAVEVARANAALDRAATQRARADGEAVAAHVEACRQAASEAEEATDLDDTAAATLRAIAASEAARSAADADLEVRDRHRAAAREALARIRAIQADRPDPALGPWLAQAEAAVTTADDALQTAAAEAAAHRGQAAAEAAAGWVDQAAELLRTSRSRAKEALASAEEALSEVDTPAIAAAVADARTAWERGTETDQATVAAQAADAAEAAAEIARVELIRHREGLVGAVARASTALQRAEALLRDAEAESPDRGGLRSGSLGQAVDRAREALERAEQARHLGIAEDEATTAEQAADAAQDAVDAHLRQQLDAMKERAAAAAARAAIHISNPPWPPSAPQSKRLRSQAAAARSAAERAASGGTLADVASALAAAEAAADGAQAVIEGALDVARQRAQHALARAEELVGESAPEELLIYLHACQEASSVALQATDPAVAEAAADRAEGTVAAVQEALDTRVQALEDARGRALVARNLAEDQMGDPPLDVVLAAVDEVRSATEEALAADDPTAAAAAADRAEAATERARTALDTRRTGLEVARTHAREALKRAEKALWEADLEPIRGALKDARAASKEATTSEDLELARAAAARGQAAADFAEVHLKEHREVISQLRQLAEEAVRRAEDALQIAGSADVQEFVDQARAAASLAGRAADPQVARLQVEQAEGAAAQARQVAEAAAEIRAGARRRASRALFQAQAALAQAGTEAARQAVEIALTAAADAEATADPAAAGSAADRAEAAARAAEASAAEQRDAFEATLARLRGAVERARSTLDLARGPTVEEPVEEARAALAAGTAARTLIDVQAAARQGEAAAVAAQIAASDAVDRCSGARERASAAAQRAAEASSAEGDATVQGHADLASTARHNADRALDPAVAEAAADQAEAASAAAQQSVRLVQARSKARRAREIVDEAANAEIPDGAPPEIRERAAEVWSLATQVRESVARALQTTDPIQATEEARAATEAAAFALGAQRTFRDAVQVWTSERADQAKQGAAPVHSLSARIASVTLEIRAVVPSPTPRILEEADRADAQAVTASRVATAAAEAGDPEGVKRGLGDLRRALKLAQVTLKAAVGSAEREQRLHLTRRLEALQAAVDETAILVERSAGIIAARPSDDISWHAKRAMEAAEAARDTAVLAVRRSDASDATLAQVEHRLDRAQKAMAAALRGRGDARTPDPPTDRLPERGGTIRPEPSALAKLRALRAGTRDLPDPSGAPHPTEPLGEQDPLAIVDDESIDDAPTVQLDRPVRTVTATSDDGDDEPIDDAPTVQLDRPVRTVTAASDDDDEPIDDAPTMQFDRPVRAVTTASDDDDEPIDDAPTMQFDRPVRAVTAASDDDDEPIDDAPTMQFERPVRIATASDEADDDEPIDDAPTMQFERPVRTTASDDDDDDEPIDDAPTMQFERPVPPAVGDVPSTTAASATPRQRDAAPAPALPTAATDRSNPPLPAGADPWGADVEEDADDLDTVHLEPEAFPRDLGTRTPTQRPSTFTPAPADEEAEDDLETVHLDPETLRQAGVVPAAPEDDGAASDTTLMMTPAQRAALTAFDDGDEDEDEDVEDLATTVAFRKPTRPDRKA